MPTYNERVIRDGVKINQLIWALLKAWVTYGNKTVLTSSYQRYEILGTEIYYDEGKDIVYIPGT